MLKSKKHLLLVFIISSCISSLCAQSAFVIDRIDITGNRRTKDFIVRRELPFTEGDTMDLASLVKKFEVARQQLMNTKLFNEAIVAVKEFRGTAVVVSIDVKERWYLFPVPYFKPADRNLSEWAKQGYAINRITYGIKFTQYNFSGRNDKLRLWLVTGYSKQVQLQYDEPYADKKLKNGFKVGFSFTSNREINYATTNNHQQFIDSLSPLKRWYGFLEYDLRPALRTFHAFRIGFSRMEVDRNISSLNPKYFYGGITEINMPEISYSVNHYHADYNIYPLKGWIGEASVIKKGFSTNSNLLQFTGKYTLAVPLPKKYYFHWQTQGVIKFPFDQPFYNNQLLGYGDFYLRGLEKYVIDGAAGIISRQSIRKELFSFNLPTHISLRSMDVIPFRIYVKAYADAGYTMNKTSPENSLSNRMLYTTGFGIDVVTFYDFVFRIDYSFNQLGENGLFLHFRNEF